MESTRIAAVRQIRKRLALVATVAGTLAVGACEGLFSVSRVCTLGGQASITVHVRDAASDIPIASGATLIQRDGAFVDSTTRPLGLGAWSDSVPLYSSAATSRPGTYAVTVRRPGYVQWDSAQVSVRALECGISPVTLTARLQSLD